MPRVSIIITTYNCAHFLPKAIESVLGQTYSDFELIIVDDGSTDDTADVVARYQDPRIRYHWQENQERSAARNKGIALSQGQYVTFLDADDWYLPSKLECQSAALDTYPDAGMAASGWLQVDATGQSVKQRRPWLQCPAPTLRDWLFGGLTIVGANLVRREWLERVGGFDTDLPPVEDTYLWFQLAWAGCPVRWVHEFVMMRRIHTENTVRNGQRMRDSRLKAVTKIYRKPGMEAALGVSESEAMATAHLSGGFRLYAAGCPERAREDLARAIQLDPRLLDNDGKRILNAMWAWANNPLVADPIAYLETILSHLPQDLTSIGWNKRRVLAGIWVDRAFAAYQQKEMKAVRQAVTRALLICPGWACNRGVVSIGLESVMGTVVMRVIRQLVKRRQVDLCSTEKVPDR